MGFKMDNAVYADNSKVSHQQEDPASDVGSAHNENPTHCTVLADNEDPTCCEGPTHNGNSTQDADSTHDKVPSHGTEHLHDGDSATCADPNHKMSPCTEDSKPYHVCGVQYLPEKCNEKSDQLKRTFRRMSIKRRSKSDGNLKSKLDARHDARTPAVEGTQGNRKLGNSNVCSLPEIVSMRTTQSYHESLGSPTDKGEDGINNVSQLTGVTDSNLEVDFSISLGDDVGDDDDNDDRSPVCKDSNENEVTNFDGRSNCQFPFENIVLSGGGSKGYAYIGALKALDDSGILSQIRRVGGSSAGAICGGLLAVGCSPQEIADTFFCNIKWLFHDQKCACCFSLPKIWKSYGINPGIRFQQIYGEQIAKKVKNPDITFLELYQNYGRELCIVVTNLTRMCSEYCHWTTTPDLPIRQAVRISMAFPVMYEPVKCNLFGQEHLYIDGGTLDQYPVHCFDGPLLELNHNLITGQKRVLNDRTLGLYVVAEEPIDYKIWSSFFDKELPYSPPYLPNTKLANELKAKPVIINGKPMMKHYSLENKMEMSITNFGHYCKASLSTVIVNQRRLHVKPEDIERTVAINCGYIGTNDYDLEPADREFMICCGYDHTQKFLEDYLKRRQMGNGFFGINRRQDVTHSPDGASLRGRATSTNSSKETEV
ncbi:hypothetical protein LSH36_189g06121 [Paralvinella palmiformis]|uniref:PNPLA domain-containing protein n=1 Tax=Paralvinella palmiformis TaxID=53620 RepID=A0AAD9JS22_9ANNE|nr:hypothetical protein LSH36_189g06121 [Paralvinella palmiformis]